MGEVMVANTVQVVVGPRMCVSVARAWPSAWPWREAVAVAIQAVPSMVAVVLVAASTAIQA